MISLMLAHVRLLHGTPSIAFPKMGMIRIQKV